ncbi:hypothetical protein TGRUB_286570 [Toxoplasma gondii RUB]|uniref:Uncharacterized protein n=13 Tax=Toxoplasma gondii TaxID=5811 RepID=A0A125YNR0_TOXGV|nr:hypothetical protein TGGT1_286570 [Toxoplasma gondii GT1]ESS30684.1 hypothetical protein TGVEG_286570 [Toxoplasma gondii VEG]KAF4643807.1 hypothetical protein TGRH88_025630 [Toxoplasma gondii]KFG40133.1 hypothetical protein TGDOM2_286570 [Toxoplasma gondii GAB2-2007-GAL-DOM2]KFG44734.1 hypothetical protein TGP89_286570 [Toxoplasma gondii p89]KFG54815.1 hypothetical protein TGFOU_286570 [Toxoplasma gondii FOU]KFG63241.1 hypothetical protein TGRUB_286570 [Toxoplasma gondii RUB]KFH06392.1 hy
MTDTRNRGSATNARTGVQQSLKGRAFGSRLRSCGAVSDHNQRERRPSLCCFCSSLDSVSARTFGYLDEHRHLLTSNSIRLKGHMLISRQSWIPISIVTNRRSA